MDRKLHKKLHDRREKGTLRSLSSFKDFVDFYSNDYLGLSEVYIDSSIKKHGATGSRLISGNSIEIDKVEENISSFFNVESALMFNSGYDANLGLFSSLPQRGDVVVYDELIHASVRDGIRLGLADGISFKHNDMSDLKKKCAVVLERNSSATIYIAVESLYSMDGDLAPLVQIAQYSESIGAYLIVDEAHACGVFGDSGKGFVNDFDLETKIFARLITFGKAYGSHGGCVLGSKDLRTFLINYARSFIYTTALPVETYKRNWGLVQLNSESRRKLLQSNVKYFRNQFDSGELISSEQSPIQIVEFGDVERTREVADKLLESKLAVKAIFSPTVPEGRERLRICIHSFNTEDQIDLLVQQITS